MENKVNIGRNNEIKIRLRHDTLKVGPRQRNNYRKPLRNGTNMAAEEKSVIIINN